MRSRKMRSRKVRSRKQYKKSLKHNKRGGRKRATKKHSRKAKRGKGIGVFGKQKPYSDSNPPKVGDTVRVRTPESTDDPITWAPNYKVVKLYPPWQAAVCPDGASSCDNEIMAPYEDMQRHGFMGNVLGIKKRYGGSRKSTRKSRKGKRRKNK